MKSIYGSILFVAALFGANILHAQLNSTNLTTIEATTPLSSNEMPASGTFYSAQNPGLPPVPANFFGLNGWNLGGGIYLLDDLGGGFSPDDGMFPGGGGGGGDSSNIFNAFTFSTNGLWLSITNVADNTVYANLNNGTDIVYEIFSTTNLATGGVATNWNIETEVFPGINTNTMPFTVPMNGRSPLFLWSRDWTGITNNGNTTPDWWFWRYYGTIDLSDTNLDSLGQELLIDYEYGVDPNTIAFSPQFPSVVHMQTTNGTLTILSGTPFYIATLVNDTNMADANWQPYTGTNVILSLGSSNGIYDISVGLKGFPTDATQVWMQAQVVLEAFTPTFTIIAPTNSTVSQPIIQLQGLFNESLSNLTYDVSNTLGVITNQQSYWNPAFYDTNVLDFTTNDFQCYDISLTNGLNTITLHAVDSEGNTATTNISFTLDYSSNTNPPVLNILWPQNGTAIAGNSFALQAQVDDDTATVTAQITDTNGDTNTVQGLVERSGLVWVNNLPLAMGTNILTVTVTNAAGNSMTTNLTLVQGPVMVTMDPLTQFNQTPVTVTGTVSDTNDAVYVNGVQAIVHCDGTWKACMVPVSPTGTAIFDIEVYTGDPILVDSQKIGQPQLAVVGLMSYISHYNSDEEDQNQCGLGSSTSGTDTIDVGWNFQSGGSEIGASAGDLDCTPINSSSQTYFPGGFNGYTPAWEINSYSDSIYNSPYWSYVADVNYWAYSAVSTLVNTQSDANAQVGIYTPDQAGVGQKALFLVSVQITNEDTGEQLPSSALQFMNQLPGTTVIDVTNGDGSVWSQFLAYGPAGTTNALNVSPLVAGQNISYNPPSWQVTNVTLQIVVNGIALDPIITNAEFCVGQQLTFSNFFNPFEVTDIISNLITSTTTKWVFTGNYVNTNSGGSSSSSTNYFIDSDLLTNAATQAWWVSGGTNPPITYSATVAENLALNNGEQIIMVGKGLFNMFRPTFIMVADDLDGTPTNIFVVQWNSFANGTIGLGIPGNADMRFEIQILSSQFPGDAYITQVLEEDDSGLPSLDPYAPFYAGTPYLDNSVVYSDTDMNILTNTTSPLNGQALNLITLQDSPSVAYGPEIDLIQTNTDYVMFAPSGGLHVCLGKVKWSTTAHATYPSTNISPNSVVGPTAPEYSHRFPYWQGIFSNPN